MNNISFTNDETKLPEALGWKNIEANIPEGNIFPFGNISYFGRQILICPFTDNKWGKSISELSTVKSQLLCCLPNKETLVFHHVRVGIRILYIMCVMHSHLNVCMVPELIHVCKQSLSSQLFKWLCGGGLTILPPNGATPQSLTWCLLLADRWVISPDHKIGIMWSSERSP